MNALILMLNIHEHFFQKTLEKAFILNVKKCTFQALGLSEEGYFFRCFICPWTRLNFNFIKCSKNSISHYPGSRKVKILMTIVHQKNCIASSFLGLCDFKYVYGGKKRDISL